MSISLFKHRNSSVYLLTIFSYFPHKQKTPLHKIRGIYNTMHLHRRYSENKSSVDKTRRKILETRYPAAFKPALVCPALCPVFYILMCKDVKLSKRKSPIDVTGLFWRGLWYALQVIRVRLELTANGLKGQCSLFYCSRKCSNTIIYSDRKIA